MAEPIVSFFHLISYEAWRRGDPTECCGVPVRQLPRTDACGATDEIREADQPPCPGPAQPPGEAGE